MKTKNLETVTINWLEPQILQKSLINGILNLTLQDPKNHIIYEVIISKIGNNHYRYEDVGMFVRFFSDLDCLLWEFELPRDLKNTIEELPIVK
jgi:hypothetical protein